MDNENKEERIQKLKIEIDEYHQLAQIQNREIEEESFLKRTFQKANHWAILLWCLIMLISAIFFVKNSEMFSEISLSILVPCAFILSCASYLIVNAIALFATSLSKQSQDYVKWKIRRVAIIFILIAIVLIVISSRWYFGAV